MSNINPPPLTTPLVNSSGMAPLPWAAWFSQANGMLGVPSGTTAQRPTTGLYPGLPYFDTSLGANGKPIWVNKTGAGWVDATGTAA